MLKRILLICIFTFCCSGLLFAGTVKLGWDPVIDPDPGDGSVVSGISHYNIYRGAISHNYTKQSNAGNVSSYELDISDVIPGTMIYLAVTAVDKANNESGFSNEIQYTVPLLPDETNPNAPTIYIIIQQ